MIFTDTHTHLFLEEFNSDRNEVVERAIKNGVTRMFIPNIDSGSVPLVKELCNIFPENCFPLAGLHPESVKEDFEKEISFIEKELKTYKYYGIGETGLDFYWDLTYKEQQVESFIKHIHLAKDYDLPLIIHVRDSFMETIDLVKKNASDNLRGIFHCFTGSAEDVKDILDIGNFFFGIGGIVTFKNGGLDKILPSIPIERIVLETDSPYLTPAPYRGKRNESSYVPFIAQKVADVYGVSVEKVAETTNFNASKVFGL